MCGRYTIQISPSELMELFGLHLLPEITDRYNIAPSQEIPAILLAQDSNRRIFKMLKWGLIPSWSKDEDIGHKLINARSETIDQKPSFREAFKKRRCLIPATGFYEWKKSGRDKQPYLIRLKDQKPFAFAGLWESWLKPDGKTIETTTILTTTPNDLVKDIHNRMPVIVNPIDYELWLNTAKHRPEQVKSLFQSYPQEEMIAYPVGKQINNPRNDTLECLERYEEPSLFPERS